MNRRKPGRLPADPTGGMLIVGHRDGIARMSLGLAESASEARGRRIVVVGDTEPGDDRLLARQLGNGLYRIRRRDYQRMVPPYMDYWQKAAYIVHTMYSQNIET